MRRPILPLLAACLGLLASILAARAAPCPPRATFDVAALQSEMMVLATACHDNTGYNAFMRRYQPYLLQTERTLQTYFNHAYGRGGQTAHDRYVTSLANAQSDAGLVQGSDFCPRNQALFSEALSLRQTAQLPLYAAGKALIPPGMPTCVASVAPRKRIVRRRRR